MAIDFPNSPTTGDTYTAGGRTWQWDGTVWAAYGNYPDPTVLKIDTGTNRVGINNTSPTTALDVTGDLTVSGKIDAPLPVSNKTASYTLAAGDEGTRIVMNNAGATTITVDDGVFSAGDTVWIHNIGAGTTTVTAGTATVNTAASLDLAQWEGGSLYFTSASSAIFFRGAGGVATLEASGGTEVTSGGYKYHTFTSSGTLTVSTAGVCEILVVAGGGGGTNAVSTRQGGGGGAGGLVNTTNVYLTDTTWTVTVGAGGAYGAYPSRGENGSASQIGALICAVGGGAAGGFGTGNNENGVLGGSGGGAIHNGGATSVGGPSTPTQGNDGGGSGLTRASAGGGGAGGAGGDASGGAGTYTGGNGGVGLDFSTWATATSTGDNGYFASGGGGSGENVNGTASDGGGGDGANDATNAQNGTANTGGGGGGAETGTPGNGGSGIVIVRYAV